jgi:hypothetical protein
LALGAKAFANFNLTSSGYLTAISTLESKKSQDMYSSF